MNPYIVKARRWSGGWELDIEGVGVTQSTSLASAENMVRSYLTLDGHADAKDADVTLEYEVTEEFSHALREVQVARLEAERSSAAAAAGMRDLARQLVEDFEISVADAARVLDVSPQRVSQLINSRMQH